MKGYLTKHLEDLQKKRIDQICGTCKKKSQMAICDECLRKLAGEEAIKMERESWARRRIPQRYWIGFLDKEYNNLIMESVVIFGEIGTGKSYLACQLIKPSGVYTTAVRMMARMQEDPLSASEYGSVRDLCIDDIAKISSSDFRLERFFDVFDSRYANNLRTILTCDLTPEEYEQKYGEIGKAIISRIREWMKKVHLTKKWR